MQNRDCARWQGNVRLQLAQGGSRSEWSEVIGSRRMARSAGMQLAASATVVSTRVTPAKVGRSVGDTPKRSPAMR